MIRFNKIGSIEITKIFALCVVLCFIVSASLSINANKNAPEIVKQLEIEKTLINPMEGDVLESDEYKAFKGYRFTQKFIPAKRLADTQKYYESQFLTQGWERKNLINDKTKTEFSYKKTYMGKEILAKFYYYDYGNYYISYEFLGNK